MSVKQPTLTKPQLEFYKTLVETPSFRDDREPGSSEDRILEFLEQEVRNIPGCTVLESDQILIAEKKNGDAFTVMLYVHVDTVWGPPDSLIYKRERDKISGLGSHDMKGGILIATEILRTVKLPEGMRLIVVYSRDEEQNSEGAKRLMTCPILGSVDVVFSPAEITTKEMNPDDEGVYVYGRRGNLKMSGNITVPRVHAGRDDAANAIDEFAHTYVEMERLLSERRDIAEHSFDKLMPDTIQSGGKGTYLSHPGVLPFSWRHLLAEKTTIENALQFQQECWGRIAVLRDWERKEIIGKLGRDTTRESYESYSTDRGTAIARIIEEMIQNLYGKVTPVFDGATADGNYIVPAFKEKFGRELPWFEKPAVGGKAHAEEDGGEWTSVKSIAKNLLFHQRLITEGLAQSCS